MQAAHQAGEEEVSLSTLGRVYTVDLSAMRQVNEQTGTARPVQRRPGRSPPPPHGIEPIITSHFLPVTVCSLCVSLSRLYGWLSLSLCLSGFHHLAKGENHQLNIILLVFSKAAFLLPSVFLARPTFYCCSS